MDERRLELKVGLLVAVAVGAVVALLAVLGELSPGRHARLQVDFAHSGNVVEGAPVKLGGVPVGRVDAVRLQPERRDAQGAPLPVRMELSLSAEAFRALRTDTRVVVATQGPLGEPYLEVSPGSPQAPALPEGAALRGQEPVRLEEVLQQVASLLEVTAEGLEKDPAALASLVGNLGRLAGSANDALSENRESLDGLVRDLSAAAGDVRVLAARARQETGPGGRADRLLGDTTALAARLRQDVPGLSADASRALAGLAALAGGLSREDGERLRRALAAYTEAGERLSLLAQRGDRVLARMEEGQGTLGALQQDAALYQELKSLVTDLRQHPWKILWKE